MLKHALRAIAFACAMLAAPAFAAGTIPYSLSQQFDRSGNLLVGCKLYIIQAGTTSTPQNAYFDTALTLPTPNPMTCDGAGRLPQFFLADGQIKIRLDDSVGNNQVVADNILVIGPSAGGGGGGGSVDPTTIIATGDFKLVYNTGVLSGFVRCNGRTIGSATSGATERANADAQALFLFLWSADPNLAVSGGRTSAAADWAANKTLTLPDCRSRALAALGDMGNADSGLLTSTYFGMSPTVLGAKGGGESLALSLTQLPTGITVTGTVSVTSTVNVQNGPSTPVTLGGAGGLGNSLGTVTSTGANTLTSNNTSGAAHRTVQPTILLTVYIKL